MDGHVCTCAPFLSGRSTGLPLKFLVSLADCGLLAHQLFLLASRLLVLDGLDRTMGIKSTLQRTTIAGQGAERRRGVSEQCRGGDRASLHLLADGQGQHPPRYQGVRGRA